MAFVLSAPLVLMQLFLLPLSPAPPPPPPWTTTFRRRTDESGVDVACGWSFYRRLVHYDILRSFESSEDCAAACLKIPSCTGLEIPRDRSYCGVWLDGACQSPASLGWQVSSEWELWVRCDVPPGCDWDAKAIKRTNHKSSQAGFVILGILMFGIPISGCLVVLWKNRRSRCGLRATQGTRHPPVGTRATQGTRHRPVGTRATPHPQAVQQARDLPAATQAIPHPPAAQETPRQQHARGHAHASAGHDRPPTTLEGLIRLRRPDIKQLAGCTGFTRGAGDCLLCLSPRRNVFGFQGCEHEGGVCRRCLRLFLDDRLEDIANFPVRCPNHPGGCQVELRADIAACVYDEESEQWSKYMRFDVQSNIGHVTCCPCCGEVNLSPSDANLHGVPVRCSNSACRRRVCIDCACEWHQNLTCQEHCGLCVDEATQAVIDQGKRCPNCGEGIIHYRGHACHHISPRTNGCPACHHSFCYVCLGPYNRCACPFQGSTFCGSIRGHDCGCPPCPDCRRDQPCAHCDNDERCPVCRGRHEV